ncbi:MAG: carboxypeptidase-like regulatory domain-containing protein, partial [Acidobacteriota bacterium]
MPDPASIRMRAPALLCGFLLLLTSAPLLAQSQATTGIIQGTVVDPSLSRLPGVTVTLTNQGTDFRRVVATDAEGLFRAVLLPLGDYRV